MRKRLLDLVGEKEPNKEFELALQRGILQRNAEGGHTPSLFYTPSSLVCSRQMYYRRTGAVQEADDASYNAINMADTGTRRHEGIQEVLLFMTDRSDWTYVNVADYVKEKGLDYLEVVGQHGAETHLRDNTMGLSFMVDGLLLHKPTNKYYLFEFKNVVSFKFEKVVKTGKILPDHHNQVTIYCRELQLDNAFVVYENRNTCELCVPQCYAVSDKDKAVLVDLITSTEECVRAGRVPDKYEGKLNPCKYCRYKKECSRDGLS